MPGPTRVSAPQLPYWPAAGMPKAAGLNHWFQVRVAIDRLPLDRQFGRPPDVLVLDGFVPVKDGEKYVPEAKVEMLWRLQPPTTASTILLALDRFWRPFPTGIT